MASSVASRSIRNNAPHLPIQKDALNEQSRHVMIVSGALELAESLQTDLLNEGYKVSVIHDGLRGLLAVKRYEPDLVLIDWAPPRLSGLDLCQRLRATDSKKQIILFTQKDCAKERVSGFNAGADDCISLPFVKEEFVSRVKASLTRLYPVKQAEDVLHCADLLLNRKTREVFRAGEFVRLTAKEFDLLEYLMTNYFVVVSRSQILENVWGYDYAGSSNIVEVYIRYLRNKLNDCQPGNTRLIKTVRSVGYILRDS
ncbi:MAG: response regulator transcription factor [Phormidesmis sp.]